MLGKGIATTDILIGNASQGINVYVIFLGVTRHASVGAILFAFSWMTHETLSNNYFSLDRWGTVFLFELLYVKSSVIFESRKLFVF